MDVSQQKRTTLSLPDGTKQLLLHSCCAPCSGEVIDSLVKNEFDFTVLFYNPNIHPKREYELRKDENKKFCQKQGIAWVDADYDRDNWFARVSGLENEPERGVRCSVCFDMRFERSALYAMEHNFRWFTSCLGISRWKDMEQINRCGMRAASRHPSLGYWQYNWRKNGGSQRMIELSKRERFYQQEYCGCVYSMRDTNRWRRANGRERIKIGVTFYSKTPNQIKGLGQSFDLEQRDNVQ